MAISMEIQRDENLLKKYRTGCDVDKEDIPLLDELSTIGLVNFGISTKRNKMTAKTTAPGLKLLT